MTNIPARLRRTLMLLAAAAFLVIAVAAFSASRAAELRPSVVVADGVITVGDLFHGAGDHADTPIIYAPPPGQQQEIGINFLYRVARAYQLDWQPSSNLDRVLVRRAAQEVTLTEIEALVLNALQAIVGDPGEGAGMRIELDQGMMAVLLPTGIDPAPQVLDISYDARSSRFAALLSAAVGTVHETSVQITGRVTMVAVVPMLSRAIGRNETIQDGDVVMTEIAVDRLQANVLLDSAAIVGQSARRTLRPGHPVREGDVRPPVLITRGATMTMVYRNGTMTLTAVGRALEDGAHGQTIRVVNTQTSRTVDALVASSGEVWVAGTTDDLPDISTQ